MRPSNKILRKATHKIAVILVGLGELQIREVGLQAMNMAERACKADRDPSWWKIPGRPYFNKQMDRLRKALS